ncbi:transcriptional regulator, HxlR family protein [Candidatus Woesearchaeota archaeon CG10_big_fil_rev_8_21_14_0_10_37_12]|nr:MAG: transcriptional regulator, HxlR family protein [Candidatus Woesearchaeota archaeon CG10_big_fil_rev_8_21_14_0_10_37_12]
MKTYDKDCCRMKSTTGYCPKPLESITSYISKKWTMSIIITIGNFGSLRFNDLLGRIEGATAKIISQRLKELEEEDILIRRSFNELPPRVEYSLTKKGQKLTKVLLPLINWAEDKNK